MTDKPSYTYPKDYRNLKYPADLDPQTLESKLNGLANLCMTENNKINDIGNEFVAKFWNGVYDVELDLVQDFWHALFAGMKGYSAAGAEVPYIKDGTIAVHVESFYKKSVVYAGNIGKLIRRNGSKDADKDSVMGTLCKFLEVDYGCEYLMQKGIIEESFLDEINEGIDNAVESDVHAAEPLTKAPGKDQPALYFNRILVGAVPSLN